MMRRIEARTQRWGGRERDAARRRRRLRPAVLALEGRTLLSTTWTVTSTLDTFNSDGTPTNGTLRWAVAEADKTTGDNIINFGNAVTGTITLSGTQLELKNTSGDPTQTIKIDGPGASVLSVDGNDIAGPSKASRVFQIDSGVTASISGLTITHGEPNSPAPPLTYITLATVATSTTSAS
jgi:hypothetical protein